MREFSFTGIPTVDYYDFLGETESRIMLGGTAIYAAAALAKQGADVLFSGPVGTDLNPNLLTPLQDSGVMFELNEIAGPQPWLKMVFADGGQVTAIKIDLGVGTEFQAEQLSDDFWEARVCWIGFSPHDYTVAVANKGRTHGCEVVLSPQGQFGDSLEDIVQLVEQLNFLNCNTAEMATLGNGRLLKGLTVLRKINPDLEILLTRGRNGAWFIGHDEVFSIPAIPQIESEFLVGAGDTFAASFHYQRIQGESIPTCLQRATVAAVLKIRGFAYTRMGTRGELLAKVEELAPRLPVEHAAWNSRSAIRWFETEDPDSTQDGAIEIE
jgi:sugar/nucleoside kinase (ribokinase family)|tara:strand:+ start:1116 stop:2090 length:975 start_codon:yes stop_codon:yes gene_type:complete